MREPNKAETTLTKGNLLRYRRVKVAGDVDRRATDEFFLEVSLNKFSFMLCYDL